MSQKLRTELSDNMMKQMQQIENEIIEMLKKIPVVLQEESTSCVASEPPA